MTMMSKQQKMVFRAGVALNNCAVTLLERGYLREGYATLKDAVFVVRKATRPDDARDENDSHTVNAMLQKAFQRSAERDTATTTAHALQLTRIADDAPVCDASFARTVPAFDGVTRLVAINGEGNACCGGDGCSKSESDIVSSIIIYNFGVSYYCLSKASRCARTSAKLLDGAIELFSLSKTILAKHYQSDEYLMTASSARPMLIATLVFKMLRQALDDSGRRVEALACDESLRELQQAASEWDFYYARVFKHVYNVAPAA